jgi:hypothetical protein
MTGPINTAEAMLQFNNVHRAANFCYYPARQEGSDTFGKMKTRKRIHRYLTQ